ncbi:MAG: caspase family protein [Deltaproteobacteria bacterium]|nr:caspase family protein [Deltaproteobacteria bacterium]
MKKNCIILFTICALITLLPSISGSQPKSQSTDSRGVKVVAIKDAQGKEIGLYKESHALIIGVSEYTEGWPKLPGVKKDVEDVKNTLQNHGFNVTVVMDPKREQMIQAFEGFINKYGLKPENRLLFYFAGHGHTVKQSYGEEMGYIVPADAPNPNKDPERFLTKAVDMQLIEVFAKRIQSKHAMFLFDSCFSGSLFAITRAVPENISYKTAKPVRQFLTSGSADEQVPDASIFRHQFIAAINGEADVDKDGYVTGTELGEFLQNKVINYSKGAQHPQYGKIRNPNLDKGDFVFARIKGSEEDASKKVTVSESQRIAREKLEEEQRKLEEERQSIETERKQFEIETEKQRLEREKKKLREEMESAARFEEERRKLEEEKRKLEEEKKKMAYKQTPSYDMGYVPIINGKVREVKFFETGYDMVKYENREYRTNFSQTNTRYIGWEIYIDHPIPDRKIDFKIESIWYYPDGSVFARYTHDTYVQTDWSTSYHNASYGWKDYSQSNWKTGTYRIDFYVSGQKIGSSAFTVY